MNFSVNKDIKRQIIFNIIYIVIVLGLTALAFYFTLRGKTSEVLKDLGSANWGYIIAILGVVLGCILARSIAVFSLTRIFDKDYRFHRAIAIDQIGSLYRMVTPAGLGSHVMETFVYNKQGIRMSNALSILAMYTIVYQVVLILYGLLSIIIKHQMISDIGYISFGRGAVSIWLLIGIGFGFNILTIGFVFLLSYWEPFYKFIKGPIYSLAHKLHLIRDLEASRTRLDASKVNFRNNLKNLLKHVKTLLVVALMFFIYITISYSVPYICGLAVGNTSATANYWDSVLLSNVHQMATCVIPIPGSAGVSELVFYNLFYKSNFYSSEDITRASLLLWRTLMFVIPLFIAFIYTIIYRPRKKVVSYENNQNQDTEVQG
ncbi:MAG: flippase-like domain-containing protein [Bacilli bacterium]|nr:flippase-like domain-containing protein [Bacilli bacterium]